jgi:hypothetical protein
MVSSWVGEARTITVPSVGDEQSSCTELAVDQTGNIEFDWIFDVGSLEATSRWLHKKIELHGDGGKHHCEADRSQAILSKKDHEKAKTQLKHDHDVSKDYILSC